MIERFLDALAARGLDMAEPRVAFGILIPLTLAGPALLILQGACSQ